MCLCCVYRLVSGNSIEEKLLKNGTKDLIREVAAQGNDYSMAFLTQVGPCVTSDASGGRVIASDPSCVFSGVDGVPPTASLIQRSRV